MTLKSVSFHSLLAISCSQILKEYFFSFFVMNNCRFYSTGSQSNAILRRQPSLYWLVSWLPNNKCSEDDHFQTGTNGKQWRSKEQTTFFKIMVAKHVASKQLDKCDWDGRVINHWILLTVPVSYESNQSGWDYNNNQLEDIVLIGKVR